MAVEERRGPSLHPAGPPVHTTLRGTTSISLQDVDERWGTSIDRDAVAGARVERAIRRATGGGEMAGLDERWLAFLRDHMQVAAFVAQDTARVLEHAADRCAWGPIARNIALQASMQTRQAQAVVLYAIDLEAMIGDMPLDRARAQWHGGRAWQPARRMLEALAARDDWAEILVGLNVCFEPLVGQLLRFEWATRIAHELGDPVTPVVAEATQIQQAWLRDWTTATLRGAATDPTHGEHNRAELTKWAARWGAMGREAATAAVTVCATLPDPAAGDDALARVLDDHAAIVASLGLSA